MTNTIKDSIPKKPIVLNSESRFQLLLEVTRAVCTCGDLDDALNQLLERVYSVVPFDAAGIFVLNRAVTIGQPPVSTQLIAGMALHGYPAQLSIDDPMFFSGLGIIGHVITNGRTHIAADVRHDPYYIEGRNGTLSEIAVPIIIGGRSIGALNLERDRIGGFTESDSEILEFIANSASIFIERSLLNRELLEKKRIEHQLEVARQVQLSLLPRQPPVIPGFETVAVSIPNAQVGGDFYDYIRLNDHEFVLVIADVAGKGVPAALIVASFAAALRAQLGHDPDILRAVTAVNAYLSDFKEESEFVTAICVSLDTRTGNLSYINCGHNPPLLIHPAGITERLETGGAVLSFSKHIGYEVGATRLNPGDLLVLYTDGVVEAKDPRGEPFNLEGLERLVRTDLSRPVAEIVEEIIRTTQLYSGTSHLADDVSLLLVRRTV
jgi:phosphoserine phosphatase RsbU/P